MQGFVKASLADLKSAAGAGVEISLKLAGVHRDTNKLFMTVTAKKPGLLGGQELVGVCHDLEWWFVEIGDWPNAPKLLEKWGVPYQATDWGF